jgi:hypothetical protein
LAIGNKCLGGDAKKQKQKFKSKGAEKMPKINVKVEARLPELKTNKKFYNSFMQEATIEFYDPETIEDAMEHYQEKELMKALRTKLKTNAMDEKRNEMIKDLRKEFNEKVGDQLADLLGI